MSERVTVIGAGISGLMAALELAKSGSEVTVLESGSEVGGVIRSVKREGFLFEEGPNSFPSTAAELIALSRELGLDSEMIAAETAAETRLIYHRHALRPVPASAKAFMKSTLFNRRQKFRIFMEPFIPARRSESPESVAHFFARRFGPAPTRTLVDAFVSGIYAGDARRLGIRSAFPSLWEMEQKSGSIIRGMRKKRKLRKKEGAEPKLTIHNYRDGMATLPKAMAKKLGDRVRLNTRVTAMSQSAAGGWQLRVEDQNGEQDWLADRVVLAVPAHVAGLLLAKLSPMAADILFDIDHAPIISVQASFPEAELPKLPQAFGYLVPRPSRMRSLGWLFTSQTFAGRAPEGAFALNGFIGGASDRAALTANEPALQHIMLGELSLALGMHAIPEPSYFKFSKWTPGLPQYDMGHHRRVDAVRRLLAEFPKLQLVGNYLNGISLNDCLKTAKAGVAEFVARVPAPEASS